VKLPTATRLRTCSQLVFFVTVPFLLLRTDFRASPCGSPTLKKTLVAGSDPVALDAYLAKTYWNLEPCALPYLRMAADRGLGFWQFETLCTKLVAFDSNF
jgi:hypothetical protein